MSKIIVTTSWDDGSISDLRLAESLSKYGIGATFYIPKAHDKRNIRDNDVKTLAQEFEIGAHSLTHPNLIRLPIEEAENEIKGSKAYLEDLTGKTVSMFSYPYGGYNADIKRVMKSCGFVGARTTTPGNLNFPRDQFEWGVTQYASSHESPLVTFQVWRKFHFPTRFLLNWETKAKLLFDRALQKGGIYHLWGHSWEIELNNEWDKLEEVFQHISRQDYVENMSNGEILTPQIAMSLNAVT